MDIQRKPPIKRFKSLNLWVHDERFSKSDLVISPSHFQVAIGDLLEIYHPHSNPLHIKKVILQVQPASLDKEILEKHPQLQISISQTIATQFVKLKYSHSFYIWY